MVKQQHCNNNNKYYSMRRREKLKLNYKAGNWQVELVANGCMAAYKIENSTISNGSKMFFPTFSVNTQVSNANTDIVAGNVASRLKGGNKSVPKIFFFIFNNIVCMHICHRAYSLSSQVPAHIYTSTYLHFYNFPASAGMPARSAAPVLNVGQQLAAETAISTYN